MNINNLPVGWKILKFKDCVLQLTTGLNPRKNFKLGQGNIKYITAKNLVGGGNIDFSNCAYINEEAKKLINKRSKIKSGDILFSSRAPIGQTHLIVEDPKEYDIGESIFSIKPKTDVILPNYLSIYLSSDFFIKSATQYVTGSVIQEIRITNLLETNILVPTFKIQQKIIDTINSIYLNMRNNNKIISALESLAKTIYDYWFLQFEFPNEEGKPYKSSGGKMVWNDELKREIPKGWDVKKIRDCVQHINTGLNPRDNFMLNEGGNIKYITVKNLTTEGTLNFNGCDTITPEVKQLINKRSMIAKGDILFSSIAPLGRCFLIYETPKNWEINESVFSIRPNTQNVNSEYLYMFFMSDWFVKIAEHASTGSVFNGIRISVLEDTSIVVPPKCILDKFKTLIMPMFKEKFFNGKQNQELASLRDFLLPMLMNGQVTFKD